MADKLSPEADDAYSRLRNAKDVLESLTEMQTQLESEESRVRGHLSAVNESIALWRSVQTTAEVDFVKLTKKKSQDEVALDFISKQRGVNHGR